MKRNGFTLIQLMMVITILAISIMLLQGPAHAAGKNFDNQAVFRSSCVAVSQSAYIAGSKHFYGVVVGSSSAGGVLAVYDSTCAAFATVPIGVIDLGTKAMYPFNCWLDSGLYYTTTGIAGSAPVSILWRRQW